MPARDVLARDYKLVRLGHDETIKSNSDGIGFFYMDTCINDSIDNTMEMDTVILILNSNHIVSAKVIDKQETEGDNRKINK